MCAVVVQRDRLAREYSEHVAARPSLGPHGQWPAELDEVMHALSELETVCADAAVVHGLEQLCTSVAVAEQALEAKQDALRMLVGPQPAPAHVLADLVAERDALRHECSAQRSLLLAAASAEEVGRLRRLWEARLQRIQSALELIPSGRTVPLPPEVDGLTELDQLRHTSEAAYAAIARRSDEIRERLLCAKQGTDGVALQLAEELSLTSSHLKFICDVQSKGHAPNFSDVSITDLSDELLTVIATERMVWATAELEQPFPVACILAAGQALHQLCEGLVSSVQAVQSALSSALQAGESDSKLCTSMTARQILLEKISITTKS